MFGLNSSLSKRENMASFQTWLFITALLLNSQAMVNVQVTDDGEDLKENLNDPVKSPKQHHDESNKLRNVPYFLRAAYEGSVLDDYDEIPLKYKMLFETTIYIETTLFCFVLFYGILHLPYWETMYNRWKNWAIQTQKEEEEDDEEEEVETEANDMDTQSD